MNKIENGQLVQMTSEEIAEFEAARAVPFERLQSDVVARIDRDVDALYAAVIGNRQAEYEAAEREAQAYADADYAGVAPPLVQAWATAKAWTGQQAADDILAQSLAWRGAQAQIRAQRLLRKEQARNAVDAPALDAVAQGWAGFVAVVRAQLGQGGGQ